MIFSDQPDQFIIQLKYQYNSGKVLKLAGLYWYFSWIIDWFDQSGKIKSSKFSSSLWFNLLIIKLLLMMHENKFQIDCCMYAGHIQNVEQEHSISIHLVSALLLLFFFNWDVCSLRLWHLPNKARTCIFRIHEVNNNWLYKYFFLLIQSSYFPLFLLKMWQINEITIEFNSCWWRFYYWTVTAVF